MKKEKEESALIAQLRVRFPNFDQLKKDYGKIGVIEVEGKYALLQKCTPEIYGAYTMALIDESKGMVVATRFLLSQLWIDGDNEIEDDDDYFMAAMTQVMNMVEVKKSVFTML